MKGAWRVMVFEFVNTATRPSFLVATFILPLLSLIFFAALANWNGTETRDTSATILEAVAELSGADTDKSAAPEGYVDQSGIIREIPDFVSQDMLRAFPDEKSAGKALEADEISAYYLVPPDYLSSGEIVYVEKELDPLAMVSKGRLLQWILRINLLDGDIARVSLIENPLNLDVTILEADSERDEANTLTLLIPYVLMLIFFSIMMSSSSLFLEGLAAEQNNSMLEVMLSTLSTRQLLAGKVFGLGIIGLLQTIVWIGGGYLILQSSGAAFNLSEIYQLPASILAWGVVYYVLAYLLYASLLAGLGALLPALNETSQFSSMVLFPLLMPALMVINFIRDPNGTISTALSLFPLTAPIAMLTRLAATDKVPLWQPVLSVIFMGAAVVLAILFAAQVFRTNNLLSGQPLRARIKRLFGFQPKLDS